MKESATAGEFDLVDKDGNVIATSTDGKTFESGSATPETLTFTEGDKLVEGCVRTAYCRKPSLAPPKR